MKSMNRKVGHPILMFNPASKVINEDGKHVFVGLVYGSPSINKDPVQVQQVLHHFSRLNSHQLLSAPDGVYTWLLYSNAGSNTVKFVCTQVLAPYEIGTRHQSLAYNSRVDAQKIYGGGELVKTGLNIEFNLLSGTYSKPLIGYNTSVRDGMIAAFLQFFPDAVYNNSGDSYIHRVETVSNDLLDLYRMLGFTVRFFNTHNDFATFSNTFWNYDFQIEYYQKQLKAAKSESEKNLMIKLYGEAIKRLQDLLDVDASGQNV